MNMMTSRTPIYVFWMFETCCALALCFLLFIAVGIKGNISYAAQEHDNMMRDIKIVDIQGDKVAENVQEPEDYARGNRLEEIAESEPEIIAGKAGKNVSYAAPSVDVLEVDTVLVPQQVTVISSSRDGQIARMPFHNGDYFKKGDVLLEYHCQDRAQEKKIANAQKRLFDLKARNAYKLFNLDMISGEEKQDLITERANANARATVAQSRLDECIIRAQFDGRVTNRLANIGEYTRTDRVLMEVASRETLQAEFLVPSFWLRWLNIDAPVTVEVVETGKSYDAKIVRIYGKVDPVTQTVQMVARLAPYRDPLMPGMSGKTLIHFNAIQKANITGYLEVTQE